MYKNIRISTNTVWRVFHTLAEPVPYRTIPTLVSVNVGPRASVFLRTQTYTITKPVPGMENSPQNIRGYKDIFTVYMRSFSE